MRIGAINCSTESLADHQACQHVVIEVGEMRKVE
jgi:hypothetical protein